MPNIKIAIDGPASSGKSTTAKNAAEKLDMIYIDTGAMYRAVTYCWLISGNEFNEENVSDLLSEHDLDFHFGQNKTRVFLDENEITDKIRKQEVTKNVSKISALKAVRDHMVKIQRKIANADGAILDGRDIGTVVFPDADLKIFLVASIDSRAERRYNEIVRQGENADLNDIKKKLIERDLFDSSRQISPLIKAKDAIEIDTSDLTIAEQTKLVVNMAEEIIKNKNNR